MTLPVFDLQTEQPAERSSARRAIRDSLPFAARFVRQADARPIRAYVITITKGIETERRRLMWLWDQTRFGTLPMTYTHPEDGEVTVLFDEDEMSWRKNNAVSTTMRVGLIEALQ